MRIPTLLLALLLLPTPALAAGGTSLGGAVSDGKAAKADIEVRGAEPWVAYSDYLTDFQLHVKKFDGTSWQEVGPVPKGIEAGGFIDLVFDGANDAYVMYQHHDGMNLIKWDGAAWQKLGGGEFGADKSFYDIEIAFRAGLPWIIYENKSTDVVALYGLIAEGDGYVWGGNTSVTAIPKSSEAPTIVSDIGDDIYVAHFERSKDRIVVGRADFDADKLLPVGKDIKSRNIANFLGMKSDGRDLYVAHEDIDNEYQPRFLKLDDKRKKWVPLAAAPAGGHIDCKEFEWTEKLAMAWLTEDEHGMTARLDGDQWSPPVKVASGPVSSLRIASDLDTTYVVFIDSSDGDKVIVRKM